MLSLRNLLCILLGAVLIAGCGREETEGTDGYITTDDKLVYFYGDVLTLEGTFWNDLGLKQIEVYNEDLFLNYRRDLEGKVVCNLELAHDLPKLQAPQILEVEIVITDLNAEITTFTYLVDYAFYPEIYDLQFSPDRDNGNIHFIQGRLEDPHGIKTLELHSLRLGDLLTKQFPKGIHSYDLNESFWFPSDIPFGEYPITLQIVNQRGFNLTITDFEGILGN